ncbi:FCD domain-containing protein [Afipia sp. Root123D2]|uniref:FadR/GntR family transcriptional regulator n=1 Tax=Afipia sp. Root123D2 TaxID=1736436 RepID=UPI0009E79CEC|nr:FCD domain-containing protein [Afipia sp. Root123D2]
MTKASKIAHTNLTNSHIGTDSVEGLRRIVARAEKSKDKRLPPEREMAEMLKVSRSTLRQSLAILEQEGVIWRHVGRGTFVGSKSRALAGAFDDLASATSPNEVMEARLAIEPKLASIAALRVTPAEIKEMNRVLDLANLTTDVPKYERLDGHFHRLIAESSRNSLLLTFFNAINAMREEEFWGKLKEKRLKPIRITNYNSQHQELLKALKQRDAARAEEMMTIHLQTVQRDLQE